MILLEKVGVRASEPSCAAGREDDHGRPLEEEWREWEALGLPRQPHVVYACWEMGHEECPEDDWDPKVSNGGRGSDLRGEEW